MISLIICSDSGRENNFQRLSENVRQTIGVTFEIIRTENDKVYPGICKAYNDAAAKAKYSYLCFIHDDVSFITDDWGKRLISHFETDHSTGLIGILGSVYKTKMVIWWPHSKIKGRQTKRINVIQHYKYSPQKEKLHFLVNPENEPMSRVASIDGVFMATTKEIWSENKFDEKLLNGFHGYDQDFSLQVGRTKKLYVVYDITIEHFSEGNFDCACLIDYLKVHKKWKKALPLLYADYAIDNTFLYSLDFNQLRKHIKMLVKNGHSFPYIQQKFFFLITLFDQRPSLLHFYKDVFAEWFILTKYFFSHRFKPVAKAERV